MNFLDSRGSLSGVSWSTPWRIFQVHKVVDLRVNQFMFVTDNLSILKIPSTYILISLT